MSNRQRQNLLYYLHTFLGVPYRYGGNTRASGLDCSGLVNGALRYFDLVPPRDHTSGWLYLYFAGKRADYITATGHDPGTLRNRLTKRILPGGILFFGRQYTAGCKVTHVAVAIDEARMIETRGGGSGVTNLAMALNREARVAITQIAHRADLVGIADPF